jgi:hypothetical protein
MILISDAQQMRTVTHCDVIIAVMCLFIDKPLNSMWLPLYNSLNKEDTCS